MSKRKKKQQPETLQEFLKTLSLRDYPKFDPETRTISGVSMILPSGPMTAEHLALLERQYLATLKAFIKEK